MSQDAADTPPTADEVAGWPGIVVVDATGVDVGRVDHVYVARGSDRPTFAAVSLPDGGRAQPLVPVELLRPDGRRLRVDVDAEVLRAAPGSSDDGALTPADEAGVRAHYGLG